MPFPTAGSVSLSRPLDLATRTSPAEGALGNTPMPDGVTPRIPRDRAGSLRVDGGRGVRSINVTAASVGAVAAGNAASTTAAAIRKKRSGRAAQYTRERNATRNVGRAKN